MGVFEKTRTEIYDKTIKVTKFYTEESFKTIIVTEKFIKLSCGHEDMTRGRGRDRAQLKTMDCWYCQQEWQTENNCDWQGIVNESKDN